MTTVRRNIPALLLGMLLCMLLTLGLSSSAWADGSTPAELQAACNEGQTSFRLTGDMTITGEEIYGMQGSGMTLEVPAGTELTITAGSVELSGLKLTGGRLNLRGGRFRVNRSFAYIGGSVYVYGCWNLFPAADVLSYNYGEIFSYERADADNTKLLFDVTTEEEFAEALTVANGFDSDSFVANIRAQSPLTMTGRHTITHRTEINFHAGLTMQSGSAIVYDHAGGSVFFQNPGGENAADAVTDIHGELNLNNISIGRGCVLKVGSNSNVNAGQMELAGTVELRDNGRLRVNNELAYNGGIINDYGVFNLYLPATGTLDNPQAVIADMVKFPNGTGACNVLFSTQSNEGVAAALAAAAELTGNFGSMISINGFTWTPAGEVTIPEQTEVHMNGSRGGRFLLSEEAVLNLPERGNLVLEPGSSGEIRGKVFNGGIVVREDAVLNSSGLADFSKLTLAGTVKLSGGIFRVNNKLQYNGGTVEFLGECFNLFPAEDVWPGNTGFLDYGSDDSLKTSLLFRANTAEEFGTALSTINELPDRFVANLQINGRCKLTGENIFNHKTEIRVNADRGGSLHIGQGALLANNGNGGNVFIENRSNSDEVEVSEIYGELNTNGLSLAPGCVLKVGEGGAVKTHDQLNIPEGAKLTITKGQMHLMDNSVAVIRGSLENNGFINMHQRSGSEPRLVIDGGNYSGGGRIGVKDTVNPDSYFSGLDLTSYVKMTDGVGTQYILVDADLILPNDLTTIESGAFAGDTFKSVYISPNVTVIEDDAFAGMSGLTIYGFPKTAAQGFAEAMGYTFVNVG